MNNEILSFLTKISELSNSFSKYDKVRKKGISSFLFTLADALDNSIKQYDKGLIPHEELSRFKTCAKELLKIINDKKEGDKLSNILNSIEADKVPKQNDINELKKLVGVIKGTADKLSIKHDPRKIFTTLGVLGISAVAISSGSVINVINSYLPSISELPSNELTKPYNIKTIERADAFKTLFENTWSLQPYTDDDTLPCFLYQGKWEGDEKHYMEINDGDYYIYYVSKSINLYAWCKVGNKGKTLEGLELLTNEVYKSEKKTNPFILSEDKLVGEVSALFFDEIEFEEIPSQSSKKFRPIKRKGKRIGRYKYVAVQEEKSSTIIMDRAVEFIKNLVKPSCGITTKEINYGANLIKNKSVLEFNCKYTPSDNGETQEYKKSIVYRGKRD